MKPKLYLYFSKFHAIKNLSLFLLTHIIAFIQFKVYDNYMKFTKKLIKIYPPPIMGKLLKYITYIR